MREGILGRGDRRLNSSPHWVNVVTTMGAISAPGTYVCLRDFISVRLRGNVDESTFHAIRAALPALGHVRSPEQRQILGFLSAGADPTYWMGLFWSHPHMGKKSASDRLAELCVDGLAYTGTAEADSALAGLQHRADRPGWVESIGPARRRNAEIRSLGLVEYLRSQRRVGR